MNENFCCSTLSLAFGVVSGLDFSHYHRYVVMFHCLTLHFFMTYDVEHLYIIICHLYIFFGEVSVKVFGPFFHLVVCFLTVEF